MHFLIVSLTMVFNTNIWQECGSPSTLVGKGKDMLVGGSSNVMNEVYTIFFNG
jgi:hypothetical protein